MIHGEWEKHRHEFAGATRLLEWSLVKVIRKHNGIDWTREAIVGRDNKWLADIDDISEPMVREIIRIAGLLPSISIPPQREGYLVTADPNGVKAP